MTPDQKRAHLALHGVRLWTLGARTYGKGAHRLAWRLIRGEPRDGMKILAVKNGTDPSQWRSAIAASLDSYEAHSLNELPDVLLERLELSLVNEHLLGELNHGPTETA